jgi:hypothetical protein
MEDGNHREGAALVRALEWCFERVGRGVEDGSGEGMRFTLESEVLRRVG